MLLSNECVNQGEKGEGEGEEGVGGGEEEEEGERRRKRKKRRRNFKSALKNTKSIKNLSNNTPKTNNPVKK